MGAEAICTVRVKRKTASGKARLETDVLEFRGGDVRLAIPFAQVSKITTRGGVLTVTYDRTVASFVLGPLAPKWAEKIRNPPSRLDKLGVKAGHRVALVNLDDEQLARELASAEAIVSRGRASKISDAIFYGVAEERDLVWLLRLKAFLQPAGALWVIRPKGRPEISERAVMAAGKAAGLVDVKVVSFSPTHTAQKFVIPVAKRDARAQPAT